MFSDSIPVPKDLYYNSKTGLLSWICYKYRFAAIYQYEVDCVFGCEGAETRANTSGGKPIPRHGAMLCVIHCVNPPTQNAEKSWHSCL